MQVSWLVRNNFLALLLISVFSFKSSSQVIKPITNLNEEWEQFHDEIPISGSTLVGLMNQNDQNSEIIAPIIYCNVSVESNSNLCLEISSIDGIYEATLEYSLTPMNDSIIKLSFPSKHFKKLKAYSQKELSLIGKLTENSNSKDFKFIPMSWSMSDLSNIIEIYVNSDDYVSFQGYDENGNEKVKLSFKKVESEKPVRAFNKVCRIDRLEVVNLNLIIRKRYRIGKKTKFIDYEIPL